MWENLLHLLGLSGEIPGPIGPYSDVGVLPYRFEDSVFSKIFYPVGGGVDGDLNEGTETARPPAELKTERKEYLREIEAKYGYRASNSWFLSSCKYTRRKVVQGFCQWLGAPKLLMFSALGHTKFNFKYAALPKLGNTKFPIVMFSHGLGGNADIYSKFCSDVASLGYVVIAVEHEDGSGSYAYDAKNQSDIFYNSAYDFAYTRSNVVGFRDPFLKQRVHELDSVFDAVTKLCTKPRFQSSIEDRVFKMMDLDTKFLAGHSFGGATAVMYAHHGKYRSELQGVTVLDIWSYPIPDTVLSEGISVPLIGILTERFLHSPTEFWPSAKLFKHSNAKMFAMLPGVTHTQMSDGPWFFGLKVIKRKGFLEGEMSGEESQDHIISAVRKFFENPNSFTMSQLENTKLNDISDVKPNAFD